MKILVTLLMAMLLFDAEMVHAGFLDEEALVVQGAEDTTDVQLTNNQFVDSIGTPAPIRKYRRRTTQPSLSPSLPQSPTESPTVTDADDYVNANNENSFRSNAAIVARRRRRRRRRRMMMRRQNQFNNNMQGYEEQIVTLSPTPAPTYIFTELNKDSLVPKPNMISGNDEEISPPTKARTSDKKEDQTDTPTRSFTYSRFEYLD